MMIKLRDLFYIEYGNQVNLNKMEKTSSDKGVRFIRRSSENLGFQCYVELNNSLKLYKKGDITVTLGGSILSAFVQPECFYTGQNIKILSPKIEMTDAEKYFYCYVIMQNRFRYTTHGREANKTLDDLVVPSLDELPTWVNTALEKVKSPNKKSFHKKVVSLNDRDWKWFRYGDIFNIYNGYYNKKPISDVNGEIPFIGATEYNNGITSFHNIETIENTSTTGDGKNHQLKNKIFKGGDFITISNNGSVGFAFYQPNDFTCSHGVNPISIKGVKMNPFIAMFICSLIHLERFRWGYGRTWRPMRMPNSKIKLPVTKEDKPDWQFMEYYLKSLPYSMSLK